ncbi:hypothetical protein BSM4216_0024 [Bacillus smithii]|nr:hypothetical protein BSM4216_0024 [Bacillus smithii]
MIESIPAFQLSCLHGRVCWNLRYFLFVMEIIIYLEFL